MQPGTGTAADSKRLSGTQLWLPRALRSGHLSLVHGPAPAGCTERRGHSCVRDRSQGTRAALPADARRQPRPHLVHLPERPREGSPISGRRGCARCTGGSCLAPLRLLFGAQPHQAHSSVRVPLSRLAGAREDPSWRELARSTGDLLTQITWPGTGGLAGVTPMLACLALELRHC